MNNTTMIHRKGAKTQSVMSVVGYIVIVETVGPTRFLHEYRGSLCAFAVNPFF